jgi:hypothetical protein
MARHRADKDHHQPLLAAEVYRKRRPDERPMDKVSNVFENATRDLRDSTEITPPQRLISVPPTRRARS